MPQKGEWVEIENIIMETGERAPALPPDTAATPLVMRVRGFVQNDAAIGDVATIITRAGRTLSGKLVDSNPPYEHTFGAPIPELAWIGPALRAQLAGKDDCND